MADGLYPIGDTEEELLTNYTEVLKRAEKAGFTFKPSKTMIAPRSSVLFGWRLEDHKWTLQEHVVCLLSRAQKPSTVKQMRSFLGAYKQISECIPQYSVLLSDFEKLVGSRGSAEKITWTEDLNKTFLKEKEKAGSPEGIFIPTKNDRMQLFSVIQQQRLKLLSPNQPLSQAVLSLATRNLNNRVRANGRSALETITSRDLLTSKKIDINDQEDLEKLEERRAYQHKTHENFQAKTKIKAKEVKFKKGDLVMHRDLPNFNKKKRHFRCS